MLGNNTIWRFKPTAEDQGVAADFPWVNYFRVEYIFYKYKVIKFYVSQNVGKLMIELSQHFL